MDLASLRADTAIAHANMRIAGSDIMMSDA
ncbi:hypothetical protein SEEE5646_25014, partial [Salmonella enterica subsp. enterica serovar Enteritidis str. 50-5646]